MGRPETISCTRCGTDVAVKSKGPVPKYCPNCRGARSKPRPPRPSTVSCERCGADVPVASRGPLPRSCRGGCAPADHPADQAGNGADGRQRVGRRPRATHREPAGILTPGAELALPIRAATSTQVLPSVTHIDELHPPERFDDRDIRFGVWLGRMRRYGAVAAWFLVVLVVLVVLLLGLRPAPTDFESLSRLVT